MDQYLSLPPELASKKVSVSLVGCGGNGSSMLTNLARLNHALIQLNHPGLHVTAYDGDFVSTSNVGRQCFFAPDIGRPKSSTLIQRFNLCFGTRWRAVDSDYQHKFSEDMIIVCVDSAKSRKEVSDTIEQSNVVLMDLGNGPDFGQVLMGGFDDLPSPYEQLPSLIDLSSEDTQMPTCSADEALSRQELFVNSMAGTLASQLLWELFRKGRTNKAGFYFNLNTGKTLPVSVLSARNNGGAK